MVATPRRKVVFFAFRDIRALKTAKVRYRNLQGWNFRPELVSRVVNRLYSFYVHSVLDRKIKETLDELDADIIITDTAHLMLRYQPADARVMKVLAFHSVCYKKYFLHSFHLDFDLLLLPGKFHRERIGRKRTVEELDKLKVVGWPRSDAYYGKKIPEDQKAAFLKKLGLDPKLKTVLYAPTHNSFHNRGLFPESFGEYRKAFEEFCCGLQGDRQTASVIPQTDCR